MKVLIVDDNKEVRNLVKRILSKAFDGNTFIECKDGLQAVESYEKDYPDLVLMDIIMNNLDGLKAARRIIEKNRDARIIIVSQLPENEYRQEAQNVGAIDFLNKENLSLLPELIKKNFHYR